MKHVQCEKCGNIWEVSALRDDRKMFICPDCEDKLLGRPYRTRTNVWTSED